MSLGHSHTPPQPQAQGQAQGQGQVAADQAHRHLAGGYCTLSPETDLRHADAILKILLATESMRGEAPDVNKHQREVITKYWQYPRLPAARMVAGMPEGVLWSKAAADSWASWPTKPKGGRIKPPETVTLDHLVPQAQLLGDVRPRLHDPEAPFDASALADLLRQHHGARQALLCVITCDENKAVRDNGWQSTNPFPDDPLQRYEQSGIPISTMMFPANIAPTCRCAT